MLSWLPEFFARFDHQLMNQNVKPASRTSTGDPELDQKLQELVNQCCTETERRYVYQIAVTSLRLGIDCAKRVDLKIANAALKEMRRAQ